MARRIVIWITREDYPAFRQLFPNDFVFPASYDAWEQLTQKEIAALTAIGETVATPVIHPEHFTAYCNAAGINYDMASLHAFAVATDRQESDRRK